MTNILKKYKKIGKVQIGTDNKELNSPTFEIISVFTNTVDNTLNVEIKHLEENGSYPHQRSIEVQFNNLPTAVKATGKTFLDAIEAEILKLPQYSGATEV